MTFSESCKLDVSLLRMQHNAFVHRLRHFMIILSQFKPCMLLRSRETHACGLLSFSCIPCSFDVLCSSFRLIFVFFLSERLTYTFLCFLLLFITPLSDFRLFLFVSAPFTTPTSDKASEASLLSSFCNILLLSKGLQIKSRQV